MYVFEIYIDNFHTKFLSILQTWGGLLWIYGEGSSAILILKAYVPELVQNNEMIVSLDIALDAQHQYSRLNYIVIYGLIGIPTPTETQ